MDLLPPQEPSNHDSLLPEREKTDSEKREVISQKFYTLSSAIKISLESLIHITSSSNKKYIMIQPYFILNEKNEQSFMHELDNVNLHIGMASSVLDSYITFTKSQPDFTKFFNIFYQLHKFIMNHRKTIFYIANSRNDQYLYPYITINNTLHSMHFLLSRLCGNLMVAGDYIQDQPPSAPSSYIEGQPAIPYREGYPYTPYYPASTYDWRDSLYPKEQQKKKQRDIGDIDDKI